MKRLRIFALIGLLTIVLLAGVLAMATTAGAQTGGGYDLTWSTIDGGGGTSTGGSYSLSGTVGQPDAGSMGGGSYTLGGGFWTGITQALQRLFLPLLQR
jgi:hypothetical protein